MYDDKHYSIPEIAQTWGISQDLARSLFCDEDDVIRIPRPAIRSRKRKYTTMRVPENVVRRVHAKLTAKSGYAWTA
jgi:hypothetical protein